MVRPIQDKAVAKQFQLSGQSCCQAIPTISHQCRLTMIDALAFTTEESQYPPPKFTRANLCIAFYVHRKQKAVLSSCLLLHINIPDEILIKFSKRYLFPIILENPTHVEKVASPEDERIATAKVTLAFGSSVQQEKKSVAIQGFFINFLAFLEKFFTISLAENVNGSSSSIVSLSSDQPMDAFSSFKLPSIDSPRKLGSSGISRYKCFKMNRAVS
ncbi:hypothetical protein GOBAR_DD28473 [Gossypium barbadense]|nr:hypothetical protein GOBAR_DD28473 [Gossypium barbadense]